MDYLHTPKNRLELDKWNFYVDKSKSMPKKTQELIFKKLHGGTKVWCIQLCTLIINTAELAKYRRWLPMLVCLLTLAKINKIVATHYKVIFLDKYEYTKLNINAFIEKWTLYDMFWTPRVPRSKYTIKLRGNEVSSRENGEKRIFVTKSL